MHLKAIETDKEENGPLNINAYYSQEKHYAPIKMPLCPYYSSPLDLHTPDPSGPGFCPSDKLISQSL